MTPCCRNCQAPLAHVFCDLGTSPIANSLIKQEVAGAPERIFPLVVYVCDRCFLVQLPSSTAASDHFHDDYVYFSSTSSTWLAHAEAYCRAMVPRLGLDGRSRVIEVASNDGYLLQYFKAMGIPVLGIEPSANTAKAAQDRHGIETLVRFFGRELAEELRAEGRRADLILGNNVFAHVPDLHDFTAGLAIALAPEGTVTLEFPHLLRLMAEGQFDTIYHEHYSYLSLGVVDGLLARHGLRVFDLEELATHGGSLRIFARHAGGDGGPRPAVERVLAAEAAAGLGRLDAYAAFGERVRETKRALLAFLIEAKREGKSIVGYGAAAKGNTLLNYCGIRTDFLDFVVDKAPSKQGRLLPGTRIPVHAPQRLLETKPDYVLILPWNLRAEIMEEMAAVRDWGGRFVVPIPQVEVLA